MHNLETNFHKIRRIVNLHFANLFPFDGNAQFYPRKPKCTDIDIVSLAMTAEALSLDSENLLFSKLHSDYPALARLLPDRTNYNRRRRRLHLLIDQVSTQISTSISNSSATFIIDAMPIPICRNARAGGLKIMREPNALPPKTGYSAIDKQYYYGYKIHLLTTENGLIQNFVITGANAHDVTMVRSLVDADIQDAKLIGDKGYIGKQLQLELWQERQIQLVTPMRTNQNHNTLWNWSMRAKRKRIETTFSQFCDQFMFKRNYAKTFDGFFSRVISKIAACSVLQLLNHLSGKPINHLKHALAA